jgi:hypothetical protein
MSEIKKLHTLAIERRSALSKRSHSESTACLTRGAAPVLGPESREAAYSER